MQEDLALAAAVRAFRRGQEAEGSRALAAFVDGLLAGLVGGEVVLDPARVQPLLSEILAAKARGDDLGLADLLVAWSRRRLGGAP